MFYNIGYGAVIAITNFIIYVIVAFSGTTVRHRNVTNEGKYLLTTLFIAQFINTCLPVILVNIDLSNVSWISSFSNEWSITILD